MLFDSHCHLTDERLVGEVEAVVGRAREAGVDRMVTIGADPEDMEAAVALAARFDGVWASVGVHPHVADRATPEVFDRIVELAGRAKVVALGETGLDYYYDNAPREGQRRAFVRHLELGAELDLPVVVHTRSADEDTIAVLREAGRTVQGVLHCFTGGWELLETALDLGWYVSFSGVVTFKNFDGEAVVRAVPADRLLIETDSPYLAPVPMRGRRNEPAFVRHVAEGVARIRGESFEVVAARTSANAARFYRLPDPGRPAASAASAA